jgi:hypothetical protein
MKGITTLAALPSGAGQAAALPAEVGEAKAQEPIVMTAVEAEGYFARLVAPLVAALMASTVRKDTVKCRATVPVIDQSPESIARLVEVTSPAQYEMRHSVLWSEPETLILSRGLELPRGAPTMYLAGDVFEVYSRVVTTDEKIAKQLSDAGYSLSMWMDVRQGIGWEVSL